MAESIAVSGHEIVAIESVASTETGFLVDANVLAARVSLGSGNDEAPVVMAADGASLPFGVSARA
jgi:hypothetical protein